MTSSQPLRLGSLPLSLLLLGATGTAQGELYRFQGDSPGDSLDAASGAGDVNGDGFADLIVGMHRDDNNGLFSGTARVYSGADGLLLYNFEGNNAYDFFGISVSGAGDVNADGFADVIIGASQESTRGSARVCSGLDGTTLYTFLGDLPDDQFGTSVSAAGDVNNDGHDDVIVGAYGHDSAGFYTGMARVFSGVDGTVLYTFLGDSESAWFGFSVDGVGDLDNDGHDDVVVGAPYDTAGGNLGSARALSGADGSILYTFRGTIPFGNFGRAVAGAGDVNADGSPDIIVGEPFGAWSAGIVRVFSGVDGSVLREFFGDSRTDHCGSAVDGAGDMNGDGFGDLIVGSYRSGSGGWQSGKARVISGFDSMTLYTFDGPGSGMEFGISVSSAGDVDGDGRDEVIVASRNDGVFYGAGTARVFSCCEDLATSFCFGDGSGNACPCGSPGQIGHGCANTSGYGARIWAVSVDSDPNVSMTIAVAGATPNAANLFFQGQTALNGGLGIPFGGGLRCTGNPVKRLGVVFTNAGGAAQRTLNPALDLGVTLGDTRHYQGWYRDSHAPACAAGFNLTDAIEIRW